MLIAKQQAGHALAIDDLCDRFEDAWRRGERPSIDDWTRQAESLAQETLPELVALELEYRLRAGETVTAAQYLERYPELGAVPEIAIGIVAAEYRLAKRIDAGADEERFRHRYPELSSNAAWSNGPWVAPGNAANKVGDENPTEAYARDETDHAAALSLATFLRNVLSPPLESGEIGRLGEYRILGILGEGGMGVVLKGEQTSLSRPVALKLMKPDPASPRARMRFQREARAAAAVEHPRIVIIYAVGEIDGTPFIAMPLMKGRSLASRLAAQGAKPLPLDEAVRYAREMAEGLAAAHARNLIHRDIKPDNVWLEESGDGIHVRLLDFGLVVWDEAEPLTHSKALMGTPAYMAPEQADGQKVDGRADLFSLGCVLYQMATGQRAFTGASTMAILTALAVYDPPSARTLNPKVPAGLSALIDRLLSKAPEGRPASAAAVVDELRSIESGSSANQPAIAPTPSHTAAHQAPAHAVRARRGLAVGATVAIAGIVLAIVLVLALRQKPEERIPLSSKEMALGTSKLPLPPAAGPEGPASVPKKAVIPDFRIKPIELTHWKHPNVGLDEKIGVLGEGKKEGPPVVGDLLKIRVELTRPGYGYLLAFRPDNKIELCAPLKDDEAPKLSDALVYHPTHKDIAYGLDDGEGLWAFAVVASEKPLPPFGEWKKRLGDMVERVSKDSFVYSAPSVWKPVMKVRLGPVWWHDGNWLTERENGVVLATNDRGGDKKIDSVEQRVTALAEFLGAAAGAEGAKAAAIGFGVGPIKK